MATTVSNVQEALKYGYGENKVLYLFNEESPTWAILSKEKKQVGGRGQFIMPLMVQNRGAFTGIAEGGALPSGLAPDTAEATFALQEYVAVYDLTWKLIEDARTDKFAFQQAVQMLEEGLKRRIMRNLNSDLIGSGRGELAVLAAVDDGAGVFTSTFMPRLEKGMVVDSVDVSSNNGERLEDSLTVNAVDYVNRTVTLSAAMSSEAAGDLIVIQDTYDDSENINKHSYGLLGVVDSADPTDATAKYYGGIQRSTAGNEFWQSAELSNGGVNRAFTEDLGLQAEDAVREKGSGRLNAWLSNLRVTRRYHEILRNETMATFGSVQPVRGGLGRPGGGQAPKEDGRTPYEFSGIPWYADPYFHNNVIIGLDTNHFFLGVGKSSVPRPISEIFEGQPFFRQTTSATWEVVWYYQMQLISNNPAAAVKINDVAEA
jgi:hypothetical protein